MFQFPLVHVFDKFSKKERFADFFIENWPIGDQKTEKRDGIGSK